MVTFSNGELVQPPKSQDNGVKPSPARATTTAPRTIHPLPARPDTRTAGQPPIARPAVSQPKGSLVDFSSHMKAVKMPISLLASMETKPVCCPQSNPSSDTKASHAPQAAKKKSTAPAAKCDTYNVSTGLAKHVETTSSGLAPPIGVVNTRLDIITVGNPKSDHGTISSASSIMIDECDSGVVLIDLENKTELIRPNPFLIAAMRTDRGAPKASDSH